MTTLDELKELAFTLKNTTEKLNKETLELKKQYENTKNEVFKEINSELGKIHWLMYELDLKNSIIYTNTGLKEEFGRKIYIKIDGGSFSYTLICATKEEMPYNGYQVQGHWGVSYNDNNLYEKRGDKYIYNIDLFLKWFEIWETVKNDILTDLYNQIITLMLGKSEKAIEDYKKVESLIK